MYSLHGVQQIQEFGEVISVLLRAGRCKILPEGTEETQRDVGTPLLFTHYIYFTWLYDPAPCFLFHLHFRHQKDQTENPSGVRDPVALGLPLTISNSSRHTPGPEGDDCDDQ